VLQGEKRRAGHTPALREYTLGKKKGYRVRMRPTPSFPAELIAAAGPVDAALQAIVERLHDDVVLPARATAGSAGYDLRAYLKARTVRHSDGSTQNERAASRQDDEWGITLEPGEMALVPLGFRTRLPHGVEGQVRPRSGQVFKHALTIPNAPGTVDADYAEEWMVIVRNDAPVARRVLHGERIAQVVFARHVVLELEEGMVQRSTERAGGFGSTGKS
jgi:dUTP pyrophosphatase